MRIILIGKNSQLYRNFLTEFSAFVDCSISHKDVKTFKFCKNDIVLLLSYASDASEQRNLMNMLHDAKVEKIIIFSSTSCIVAEHYKCYKYPVVKLNNESEAKKILLNATIIRLGTVVNEKTIDLYKGTFVTDIKDVIKLCVSIAQNNSKFNFLVKYKYADFTDKKTFEYRFYLFYGWLISHLKWPCLIRPIDFFIKVIFRYKWYGYGVLATILYSKRGS